MTQSRHNALKRAVSEAGVRSDTALVEAAGIVLTVAADPRRELRGGAVEVTQLVTMRRLRSLFDDLGVLTQLAVRAGGGVREYTIYRLHFAAVGARPEALQRCVTPRYLRDACADPAQARALWRGVLLASQPQRRRMPGFAVAVRDSDLARLLVDIASTHFGVASARRAAAPPGSRVIVADSSDAERIIGLVLTDESVLATRPPGVLHPGRQPLGEAARSGWSARYVVAGRGDPDEADDRVQAADQFPELKPTSIGES